MQPNTISELADALRPHIAALAEALIGTKPITSSGREYRFRSKGSLAVVVAGPQRGAWFDHEAGRGGNPFGLILHLKGGAIHEAIAYARAFLGTGISTERPVLRSILHYREPKAPSATLPLAERLWLEALPVLNTLVEIYLRSRGLELPDCADVLRFHPCAWRSSKNGPHGPAMLAQMTTPTANPQTGWHEPCGIHVTYLKLDGSGKADGPSAKVMLGHAGIIRLSSDENVTLGLGIAEGLETALSVAQHFKWCPIWAATSAGAIAGLPVLEGIESLTIFADADRAGLGAAEVCGVKWREAGKEVRITVAPAGLDFNDVAMRLRQGSR